MKHKNDMKTVKVFKATHDTVKAVKKKTGEPIAHQIRRAIKKQNGAAI